MATELYMQQEPICRFKNPDTKEEVAIAFATVAGVSFTPESHTLEIRHNCNITSFLVGIDELKYALFLDGWHRYLSR